MASIWRLNDQNFWVLSQNDESDKIIVHCIDLTSKRSKLLSYVAKLQNDQIIVHWIDLTSKRFKTWVTSQNYKSDQTTKVIKAQWIASIWRQNDLKSWVTSLNYKSNQITIDCIDLTSNHSKMLRYVAKHSKQRKPTKVIKL